MMISIKIFGFELLHIFFDKRKTKKCPYCDVSVQSDGLTWSDGSADSSAYLSRDAKGFYITINGFESTAYIHNCPKCGRDLTND